MNIPIELIIILAIFLIFLIWSVWFRLSKRRLIKNYNPEKDKGRKRKEPSAIGDGRGEPEVEDGEQLIPRPPELTERTILPTTSSGLPDKNRQRLRGIFGKRRR